MRLREDRVEDYARAHAKGQVWQSVLDGLSKCGIERMIIFQDGREVILFEAAEDLEASYRNLAQDGASMEWDRMVAQWMEKYPSLDGIGAGDVSFEQVSIVFNFERGALF